MSRWPGVTTGMTATGRLITFKRRSFATSSMISDEPTATCRRTGDQRISQTVLIKRGIPLE